MDPTTTKYLIRARINAEGVVEKPDIVGAIFGQTEGLLGEELELRSLLQSGRIGRIEVDADIQKGRTSGAVMVPSSLDKPETAILAAALETIDRVGPCRAVIKVETVEDVRVVRKTKILNRAKEILATLVQEDKTAGFDLIDQVKRSVQVEEAVSYGKERLPAGPNIDTSDAIIVVEGRSDVLNLLRCGIKNVIAVEGTNVPQTIIDLSRNKKVTAFLDGDRGGDLILKELLQLADLDFIARAPRNQEVEDLSEKQIMKALSSKTAVQEYVDQHGLTKMLQQAQAAQAAAPPPSGPANGPAAGAPPVAVEAGGHVDAGPGNRGPMPGEPVPAPGTAGDQARSGGFISSVMSRVRGGFTGPRPGEGGPGPAAAGGRTLSPEHETAKTRLTALNGSLKGVVMDSKGGILKEIAVRDLADSIRGMQGDLDSVVFDGVITQRLLDIAQEKGIKRVVGVKLGTITKQPAALEVLTKPDLE